MQLAEAARRWRIKVERMRQELTATTTPAPSTTSAEPPAALQPPGAFHGWTVSCIMGGKSAINEESVARIITAGGGRAIAGKQWKAHIEVGDDDGDVIARADFLLICFTQFHIPPVPHTHLCK